VALAGRCKPGSDKPCRPSRPRRSPHPRRVGMHAHHRIGAAPAYTGHRASRLRKSCAPRGVFPLPRSCLPSQMRCPSSRTSMARVAFLGPSPLGVQYEGVK
jgi:hypothetical protein